MSFLHGMGGFLGEKEFRKVLPLSHNVQKQLDWDFMECANLGRNSLVRCEQKKQLPMQHQNTQNIRWSENLAFYWRFGFFVGRPSTGTGSFGQKMPACSKNRPWHPPILGRGKSAGFSPLTFHLLECSAGRRLHGKRLDSWEKTVKSCGRRHFFTRRG